MARAQANLQFGVFEGLAGLTDLEKLLYFAVLTEPTINQCGVGALRVSLWARRLEKSAADVEEALLGLDKHRYVLVDEHTEEILIRTLIRNDGIADRPNVLWAAVRQAPLTRSPRLRRELAAELRRLPAQLPDSVTKAGRRFVHADPHAVADSLDPPPVDNPPGERFSNGSRTYPEPISGEPFSNHTRTTGGGGGGGGGGTSPVGGCFEGPRDQRAPAPDDPQDQAELGLIAAVPPPSDRPPRCRRHRRLPANVDPGPCRGCQSAREHWERQRTQQRAADAETARRAAGGCIACHGTGWRELPPLTPTSQARAERCDHRSPLQAIPTPTDARGQPA